MKYSVTIAVGGVAEKVSPDWDEEREFRRATVRAYVQIMRELEVAGYVKVVPLARMGSYRKRVVFLDLPGLRRRKPSLRSTAT